MLTLPEEILPRPGLGEQVMATAQGRGMLPPPGPSRGDLLRLLA